MPRKDHFCTNSTKTDGTQDSLNNIVQYKWDENDRMIASNVNGHICNYWYDASGERTVKQSYDSELVYVTGAYSGARTGLGRFSLYVNPYLVATNGGAYTKHIYIGSERIVSKLGDSYGTDHAQ